ncbi:MAG: putative 2OG-Fe(II) oxygenase [Pseudomonadota bacterium]
MTDTLRDQVAKARSLLEAGQFTECMSYCADVLLQTPNEPNTLFILALAASQVGDGETTERAFLAALNVAPNRLDLLMNYSRFLRETGRAAEAVPLLERAVKLAPDTAGTWHSLALGQLNSGAFADASKSAERLLALAPGESAAWELAAAAAQRRGAVAEAIGVLRKGLERLPNAARLHYSLGQLLRENSDFQEAAQSYSLAEQHGFATADLYRNRAEALLDSGSPEDALACAQLGVQRFPGDATLQRSAARLHFEVGADGDPIASIAAAARAEPQNSALWQTGVELLRRLKRDEEASVFLADSKRAGCPETPGLLALDAMDAAWFGEPEEATVRFEKLLHKHPDDLSAKLNFATHLLSAGDPVRAEILCGQILAVNPEDQLALAYRGTALQLLGDSRESWLLDYERMVVPVRVPIPEEYGSRDAFFSDMKRVLEELHQTKAHPIEQSVRGGTQTNGFLFRLKHPMLAVLEKQIRLAILSAFDEFEDDETHPFWGRRRVGMGADDLRFAGAWSVRLQDQGFHTNHIHPEGWISSALYIALPDEVQDHSDESGYIQFGCPLEELGIDLPPRRTVRPEIGTLVLFPSYMWHGTIPFKSERPRITVAFDLLPQR